MRGSAVQIRQVALLANQSHIRPNSRMVGYITMFVVGVLVLVFSWRIYVHTQLQMDHVWVKFRGSSDLIGSLQQDDPVAIRGVRIGQVEEIVSVKDGVKVGLRFWSPQMLYRDASAANGGNGLMGMRFVLLDPGVDTAHPLDRDQEIEGRFQPGVAEVMSKIRDVVRSVKDLQKKVSVLARGDGRTPPFAKTLDAQLARIDSVVLGLEALDRKVQAVGPKLDEIGSTTRQVANSLDSLAPTLLAGLESTHTVLVDARTMLLSAREVVGRTDTLVTGISTTLDPLTRNDSLLARIQTSLEIVDQVQSFIEGEGNVKFNFHVLGDNPSKRGE